MRASTLLVCIALIGCGRAGFDRLVGDATSGDGDATSDATSDAGAVVPAIVQVPSSCTNGMKDGYETASDCGGLCERCAACATETTPLSTCVCGIEWLTPWPGGGEFAAAYAASETFAILGGGAGYVLVWDGTQFTPGYVGDSAITAASGTSSDDVWLAGTEVWHWNGAMWTKHVPPGTVNISAIHARAVDDVWAVSQNGGLHHYDGTTWTTTMPFGATYLSAVWARTATDVWVGALDGRLSSWNGTTLTPVTGAAFTRINFLSASGPSDAYLLANMAAGPAAFHWNGSTFTQLTPGIIAMEAIQGSGPNDIWVLGAGEVTHWNGATWTPTAFPAGYAGAETVSTAGRNELAVAGSRLFIADDGKRMTLAGGTWNVPGLTAENLSGIWAEGAVAHAMGTNSWLHTAGTSFVRDPAPASISYANEVLGFAPNDIWTTANNTAYQFDGSTWTARGAASGAMAGISTNDFWVIPNAAAATARHWTGAGFTSVPMPATFRPADVSAVSDNDVWASGRIEATGGPAIARWNGTTWSLITPPPATQELIQIWAASSTDVWTLSSSLDQNVWQYNGTTWTDRSQPSVTAFSGGLRGGPGGVFVWAQSRLSQWNGLTWNPVGGATPGCPSSPTAALHVNATDVWIAGRWGLVGRYRL